MSRLLKLARNCLMCALLWWALPPAPAHAAIAGEAVPPPQTLASIDTAPVFITRAADLFVLEGATEVGRVRAQDNENDALSYRIGLGEAGGADREMFSIDALSGELRFLSAPDFEDDRSAAGTTTYEVTIVASSTRDTTGVTRRASRTFNVGVLNLETTPRFLTRRTTFRILEGSPLRVLATLSTDRPADYSLGGRHADDFSITPSGVLSINETPVFVAGSNSLQVTVIATSKHAAADRATMALTVVVTDDRPPEFITGIDQLSVDEGQRSAGPLRARDRDGSPVTYNIPSGSHGGPDGHLFFLSSASRPTLLFRTAPDFEDNQSAANSDIYSVRVIATSTTFPGVAQSVDQLFNVEVRDVESNPVFIMGNNRSFFVLQAAITVGTIITEQAVAWNFGGSDEELFSFFEFGSFGFISFRAPAVLDPGGDNTRELEIVATSLDAARDTTTVEVTIMVQEDMPPIFTTNEDELSIPEGERIIGEIVTSEPNQSQVFLRSTGGADRNSFGINNNHELYFIFARDFEDNQSAAGTNEYEVEVEARSFTGDNTELTARRTFVVTVTDTDRNPVFLACPNSCTLSVREGSLFVGNFATDIPVSYQLTGADAATFRIAANGDLNFRTRQPFATSASWSLTVRATSEHIANDTTETNVTVTLFADNPPVFQTDVDAFSIDEGEREIGTVVATDGNNFEPVRYRLNPPSGANDNSLFVVTLEGLLSFIRAPDFEDDDSSSGDDVYRAQITAESLAETGQPMQASRTFQVTVRNVDLPPTLVPLERNHAVLESTSGGARVVTRAYVTDANVSWSLTGPDASDFEMSADGVLRFREPPRFVLNGNNTRRPIVVATNDAPSRDRASQELLVRIVQDLPPMFSAGSDNHSVPEGQTSIGVVLAVDPNNPTYASSVSFRINGGADAARFVIGQASGELSFRSPPDFETPGSTAGTNTYEVGVAVISVSLDNAPRATIRTVTVAVTNTDTTPQFAGSGGMSRGARVLEGITTVGRFAASVEGGTVNYELSGEDGREFAIDTDGVLAFRQPPVFTPFNSAANSKRVDIVASAGARRSTLVLFVLIDEDAAPVFSNSTPFASIPEGTRFVGNITATDANTADSERITSISYAVTDSDGADADLFVIDAATAALNFINAPDFETPLSTLGSNTYRVIVTAASSTAGLPAQTTSLLLAVTVTDLDGAPIFTAGAGPITINAIAGATEVGTFAAAIAATYSLEGPGANALTISAAGMLAFPAPVVYVEDGANTYRLNIIATDSGPSGDSSSLSVTINVAPNLAPIFTTAADAFIVQEGLARVGTVSAIDLDNANHPTLITYAIAGGADSALFSLDSDLGILAFVSPRDFEDDQSRAGNNVYEVAIIAIGTVISGTSRGATTASGRIFSVAVANSGSAPEFIGVGDSVTYEVVEGNVYVGTLEASERVNFELDGDDAGSFRIAANGDINFFGGARPKADGNTRYTFDVLARSRAISRDSNQVAVTVNVAIDEAPAFAAGVDKLEVDEGVTVVGFVEATDANDASPVSYLLTGGADEALFSINSTTGQVSFRNRRDFEDHNSAAGTDVYEIEVTATSTTNPPRGGGAGTGTRLRTEQTFMVTVNDVDGAPLLLVPQSGFIVLTGTTDPVTVFETAGSADWSLTGDDAGALTIDANGELSFRSPPTYFLGGTNERVLEVIATSQAPDADRTVWPITITINQDLPPVWTTAPNALTVEEGQTQVGLLLATDANNPLHPSVITYAIAGGADGARFGVDANTGLLSFLSPPDFENQDSVAGTDIYEVQVNAISRTLGASPLATARTFSVRVGNVAGAPEFLDALARIEALEGVARVTTFNLTAAADFTLSGADASNFTLSAAGVLSFTSVPVFDEGGDNEHDIVVVATSTGGSEDVTSLAVSVVVVADEPPVFVAAEQDVFVYEGTADVAVLTVTDGNNPERPSAITYTLSGGVDRGMFEIDSGTGTLSFIRPPDFESGASAANTDVYEVEVTVSSTTTPAPPQSITRAYRVTVRDLDAAPRFLTDTVSGAVLVLEGTVSIGSFAVDAPATFSLSGADGASFSITEAGELGFITPSVFIQGGDNDYEVTVTATSAHPAADLTSRAITINVVPDAPPVWVTASDEPTTNEGERLAAVLMVSDASAPRFATTFGYAITGGADRALFVVGATTGALSFRTAPDFEDDNSAAGTDEYEVEVTVSSRSDGLAARTATRVFMVDVVNIDEQPIFEATPARLEVIEGVRDVMVYSAVSEAGSVRYSITGTGGRNAADLTINQLTGALSFVVPVSFNSGIGAINSYNLRVVATVSANAALTVAAALEVVLVADAPPVWVGPPTFNANEGETFVGIVRASDANADAFSTSLRYAIDGGADRALFTLDDVSGTLRFSTAPDFEDDNSAAGTDVYEARIAAISTTAASQREQRTARVFAVTVLDITTTPIFAGANQAATRALAVLEGVTTTDTLFTDTAVTFQVAPEYAVSFNIDSATGELTFASAPVYVPGTANVERVDIIATSVYQSADRSRFTLIINIIDDAPPDLTVSPSNFSLEEGQLEVGRLIAGEPNGDLVTYALDTELPDHRLFRIDTETGRLRFTEAPDFEEPGSAANSNTYQLRVLARSVTLPNPPQTSRLSVSVVVTDDVDNIPIFSSNVETFITVLEGVTQIGAFPAQLADPNVALTYDIAGRDAGLFFVDGVSAEVSFNDPPVFRQRVRNTYQLDLTATSQARSRDVSTLELNISVIDDTPPVFRDRLLPPVLEGELMAAAIVATDTNQNSPVRYVLSGGVDRARFAIGEETGMLMFRAPPDFDQPVDQESTDPIVDAARNNEYVVSITATSTTVPNPPQTETITHVVTVTTTRLRPHFEQLEFEVEEGGFTVGALRLVHPPAPVMAMRVSGGADAALFNIGLTSPPENDARQLRFAAAPDYENPLDSASPAADDGSTAENPTPPDRANSNVYVVRVTVDFVGSDSITRNVLVRVTNRSEGRIVIAPKRVRHPENAAVVAVLRVIGVDDSTEVFNPGLMIAGGADGDLFQVDDRTGELSFINPPNFENPAVNEGDDNTFNVQVTASAAPVVGIVVDVIDVDEAPVLAGPFTFMLDERLELDVHDYDAIDEDGDLISYGISGVDAHLFSMNALTGELAFREPVDFERPVDANFDNVYEVLVRASASVNAPQSDRRLVRITVRDVVEGLEFSDQELSVIDAQTLVGKLQIDPGQVDPDTITFTLAAGPDFLSFRLDGDRLLFITPPSTAVPRDANGDNIYVVVVQARAPMAGVTVTDRATITVRLSPSLLENAQSTALTQLRPGTTIRGGVDAALFEITDNVLRFIESPDFENPLDLLSTEPPEPAGNNNYVVITARGNVETTRIITVQDEANEAAEAGGNQLAAAGDTVSLRGSPAILENVNYSWSQLSGPEVVTTEVGERGIRFRVPVDAYDEVLVFQFEVTSAGGEAATDEVSVQVRPAPFLEDQSLSLSEGLVLETLLGVPPSRRNFATTSVARGLAEPRGFWAIVAGNDDSLFRVNRETGQVSLAQPLDFETSESHSITIQYAQEDVTGQGMLNVAVTDRNEPPTATLSDDVRVPVDTLVMLEATVGDPEQGAVGLSYSWVQLEGAPVILDGATTAAVSFTPGRTLGGEVLVFRFTVTDNGDLTAEGRVQVEVANDPLDDGMLEPGEAMIMEDAGLGDLVGMPLVTSGFAIGTGEWRIVSGNDANIFDINSASGQVRLQGLLDFEEEPMHMLEISYRLGLLRGTGMLVITVEDVDESPTADAGPPERVVSSGRPVALDASMSADPEDMMGITYLWEQLSGTPVSLDDRTSVSPTFIAPAVTASAPLIMTFRLTVTDSTEQTDMVTQDIRVVNSDEPPVINTVRLSVMENQQDVGLIDAVDADRDPITYSLAPGGDMALFELSSDGYLSFLVAPNFEMPLGTGDTGAEDNRYLLNVVATSIRDGGRAQTAVRAVLIDVTDDTDEAPLFSTEITEYSIEEGDTEPFAHLTARDPEGNNLNFVIVAGADRSQFSVERLDGALAFRNPPDFEAPADQENDNPPNPAGDNIYVVVVQAESTGVNGDAQADTLTFIVTVTDVPDEALVDAEFDVPIDAVGGEDVGMPLVLNGSFAGPGRWRILTVTRTDPDTFEEISYRTGSLFSIDPASGQLRVGLGLDVRLAIRYRLRVRIESGDGLYLEGVANINVSPDPTPGALTLSDTTPMVGVEVNATLADAGTTTNLEWRWQGLVDGRWHDLTGAATRNFVPQVPQGSRPIRAVVSYVEDGVRRRVNSAASEPIGTDLAARRGILDAALAVIGRNLAEDALTVLGRRMTGQGRDLLNIAGHSLSPTAGGAYANSALGWMERFGRLEAARRNERNWNWRDGSSFARRFGGDLNPGQAPTGLEEVGSGSVSNIPVWVVWGETTRRTFSGRPSPLLDAMNGDTTSLWLGLDRYFSKYGLAGGALQYSESELGFSSEAEGDGKLSAILTTFYPYLHYSPVNGISLWGIAGYGVGHIHYLSVASGGIARRAGAEFVLMAGGGRYDLLNLSDSRLLLAVKADGLYSELNSNASGVFVPAASGEFSRVRVGFSLDFDWEARGAGMLVSTLELHTRLDDGDAERGLGIDVNFDTSWRHLESGFAFVIHVNKLIAHENKALNQTGYGFGISLDSGEFGVGPAISFTPTFGYQPRGGGLANIGTADKLGGSLDSYDNSALNPFAAASESRMKLKASYGILAGQLRVTPQAEFDIDLAGDAQGARRHAAIFLKFDWLY